MVCSGAIESSVAAVSSQVPAVGVRFGMTHPDLPNTSSTLWRTVFDHDAKRCCFESAIHPPVVHLTNAEDFDQTSAFADPG